MSHLTLTKIRLRNGIWEGTITGAAGAGTRPEIRVTHLDQPVEGAELSKGRDAGTWNLSIQMPPTTPGWAISP